MSDFAFMTFTQVCMQAISSDAGGMAPAAGVLHCAYGCQKQQHAVWEGTGTYVPDSGLQLPKAVACNAEDFLSIASAPLPRAKAVLLPQPIILPMLEDLPAGRDGIRIMSWAVRVSVLGMSPVSSPKLGFCQHALHCCISALALHPETPYGHLHECQHRSRQQS